MINNPTGIDRPIQELQEMFLQKLWIHLSEGEKEFNHRVFRNRKEGRLIPEVFTEKNEYKEVLFNDKLSVLSWFDPADTTNSYDSGFTNQNVGIFFLVNLSKLYTNLSHRAVEEAHRDVQNVIHELPSDFTIQGIVTGDRAYGDFDITELKHPDMQPWHTFRINCLVNFFLTC